MVSLSGDAILPCKSIDDLPAWCFWRGKQAKHLLWRDSLHFRVSVWFSLLGHFCPLLPSWMDHIGSTHSSLRKEGLVQVLKSHIQTYTKVCVEYWASGNCNSRPKHAGKRNTKQNTHFYSSHGLPSPCMLTWKSVPLCQMGIYFQANMHAKYALSLLCRLIRSWNRWWLLVIRHFKG